MGAAPFLHDFLKGRVGVPERIERVVSLYPSITEILASVGFLENIVGVSFWCKHLIKEVKGIPSVASATKVNYERLRSLNPDLIFASTGIQQDLAIELHQRGFNVYLVPLPKSLYGILDNVMVVGSLVGRREEAGKLVEKLVDELKAYRYEGRREERPKVYVELWPDRFPTTFGRLTFIDDLIYTAGGLNIFSKAVGFFKPDFDEVSRGDPDLMIFLSERRMEAEEVEPIIARRGWSDVKAVREGRVWCARERELPLTHSGPSFTRTLKILSEKFREVEG